MQDSSSNAMTEVALGLSMAFFALLVVALVSIGLGKTERDDTIMHDGVTEHIATQDIQINTQNDDEGNSNRKLFFYVGGKLFDIDLEERGFDELPREEASVLAISDSMNVKDLMLLKRNVDGLNTEFTIINEEWHAYFASKGMF